MRPVWQAIPDLRRAYHNYYRERQARGLRPMEICCETEQCATCLLFEIVEEAEQDLITAAKAVACK